ncbi:MAG: energy-coupling factor ABC transporter ATP-binding protein [Thaumarchaeota archaeon]|nr:energy-coupling factor ABC transporter ATP-binding protein [Nitrososphaerota archaeon]
MSVKDLIRFDNFSFKYNSRNDKVLEDINLNIKKNEITVLAGPTGCGKSTLLRAIVGLIPNMYEGEYTGEVTVDGIRIRDAEIKEIAKRVGFVFQNPENQIFMFSVERDIAFGLENLSLEQEIIKNRIEETMKTLNITHLAKKAPHELSDGQKQRTALAGVLAMEPKILILDEPTSLLDPKTATEFMELMNKLCKEREMSIIIVEHRLDLVLKYADRLIVLSNGKVISNDTPENVFDYKKEIIPELSVPFSTKLYRELAKNSMKFSKPVTGVEEMIKEVKNNHDKI